MNTPDLAFESVTFGVRPFLCAYVTVGAARLEFVCLGVNSRVEVYDHPDPRTALPRFCGYLPDETGRKFVQLAREHDDFPAPDARPSLAKCA